VRILLDGLGTFGAGGALPGYIPDYFAGGPSIVSYLREGSNISVRLVQNPWLQGDHTKTIIIDDGPAFVGGMNIGREYRYEWHDLMVEVTGPIVNVLKDNFDRAWIHAGLFGDFRALFESPEPRKEQATEAQTAIRVLETKPADAQILRAQIAAIRRARQRIWIENAYFTSDAILYELAKARRRGVDVRVVMPLHGDSGPINSSNALAANALLARGVRVYVYPGMSHVKGALYDGWACFGSANFDKLSLRLNRELDLATSDPDAVERFANEVFLPDFARSVELKEPLPTDWYDHLMALIANQL
jgi:cardiolipin synthase